MRHVLVFAAAMASLPAHAGYTEYDIIDFARCTSYTLTENRYDEFPNEVARRQWFDVEVPALRRKHDDSWDPWQLHESGDRYHEGVCKWTPDSIQCDGPDSFPMKGLYCRNGRREIPSCGLPGTRKGMIRLYWVDTTENEEGGSNEVNHAFRKDLRRMKSSCDRRSKRAHAAQAAPSR